MKKLLSVILAGIMIFSLAACTGNGGSQTTATLEPLTKDDVITMATISHASWPYDEDWIIWDYIAEGTGATLEVNAYPASDVSSKYAILYAAQDLLPDIMVYDYKQATDKLVVQGALIALDDMEEYMPSYNAWVKSLSDEEIENNVNARKGFDGKVYMAPVIGREMSKNVRAWLYREDTFKKHNLEVPTTYDELYEVCKKLKEIYPDSYPFLVRGGSLLYSVTGPSWKEYWMPDMYYDFNTEKWSYGAIEDTMVEVLQYHKKLIDEELMTPNFMTINSASWQELVSTDRGFIMPEYQTRIDFFNPMARQNYPEFNLTAMVPPVAKEETGVAMVNKFNIDPVGMVMPNTGDDRRIANAAKFLDWFYTDAATELLSWGKEGETYEVVDGKKQYMVDDGGVQSQASTLYGFSTYGTVLRMDPEATLVLETDDIARTREMVLEHTMPFANPTLYLAFDEEEQKIRDDISSAITTYTNEMLTKFILGIEPISNFDKFVANLKDMRIDDYISIHESAYNRIK